MVEPLDETGKPRQSVFFWVSIGVATLAVIGIFVRFAGTDPFGPLIILLGVAGLVAVVIWLYFRVARHRMTIASRAFPHALVVPIVVGQELDDESDDLADSLDDPSVRFRTTSYAAIAVDREGIHVVTSRRTHGLIPAAAIEIGERAATQVGNRAVAAIVLEVTVDGEPSVLPLTPLRTRGNPLRFLTAAELEVVEAQVRAALEGQQPNPAWSF